jgi:hypothetical protein
MAVPVLARPVAPCKLVVPIVVVKLRSVLVHLNKWILRLVQVLSGSGGLACHSWHEVSKLAVA